MLRGYLKVTCCQQVPKDLIANEPCYLCLPSLTSIYIFKQTVKASKQTICYPPEFAWLKILCIKSAYKVSVVRLRLPALPPLLLCSSQSYQMTR